MRLNTRSRYAVTAMLDLALHDGDGPVALADIVFVSEEDAAHLYGHTPIDAVLDGIADKGPVLAIAKLGARGCLIKSEKGERWEVPAWTIRMVDATGAGDAFCAGFVLSLLRDAEPIEAGRYANAVGALTATGVGAISPQPSHAEVTAFMETRSKPTQ